jgi:hypothetical protein
MKHRIAMILVAQVIATVISAAEPSDAPNPMLVSPYFPSVLVSCIGFGKATPSGDLQMFQTGEQPAPQVSWIPAEGDAVWLKLLNNTRGSITITTDVVYTVKLRDGAPVSVRYVAYDAKGKEIPNPFDTSGSVSIPSNHSVVFPVPRRALRQGSHITLSFRYDWEPSEQSSAVPPVMHEVFLSSELLPPETRE